MLWKEVTNRTSSVLKEATHRVLIPYSGETEEESVKGASDQEPFSSPIPKSLELQVSRFVRNERGAHKLSQILVSSGKRRLRELILVQNRRPLVIISNAAATAARFFVGNSEDGRATNPPMWTVPVIADSLRSINCTLQEMVLRGVDLGHSDEHAMHLALALPPNLVRLSLERFKLKSSKGFWALAYSLGHHSSVKELVFDHCELPLSAGTALATTLTQNSSIQSLRIHGGSLLRHQGDVDDEDTTEVEEVFDDLEEELSLTPSPSGMAAVVSQVVNNQGLQELILTGSGSCHIRTLLALASAIVQKHLKLTVLRLESTSATQSATDDLTMGLIRLAIEHNPNLEELSIHSDSLLEDALVKTLIEALYKNNKLKKIDLKGRFHQVRAQKALLDVFRSGNKTIRSVSLSGSISEEEDSEDSHQDLAEEIRFFLDLNRIRVLASQKNLVTPWSATPHPRFVFEPDYIFLFLQARADLFRLRSTKGSLR